MYKLIAFSFFLSTIFWISDAQAQGTTPMPSTDKGWCTVHNDTPAGSSECGFGSAAAACARQITVNYPLGRYTSAGAQEDVGGTAFCRATEHTVPDELFIGIASVGRNCAFGYVRSGHRCVKIATPMRDKVCAADAVSPNGDTNPIDVITGIKYQKFTDFSTADGRLQLMRYYNSTPYGKLGTDYGGLLATRRGLGDNWALSSHPEITFHNRESANGNFWLFMPSGAALQFSADFTGGYETTSTVVGGGAPEYAAKLVAGWTGNDTFRNSPREISVVRNRDGAKYIYESPVFDRLTEGLIRARLKRIEYVGGYSQTYTYGSFGQVSKIVDSFNREITFGNHVVNWERYEDGQLVERLYEEDGVTPLAPELGPVTRVNLPDGTYMEYIYDSPYEFEQRWNVKRRLRIVKHVKDTDDPSVTLLFNKNTYHYEDTLFPFNLTGITDTSDTRYATWEYGEEGRGISSEHAGGVNRTTITYGDDPNQGRHNHVVTNALGKQTTYQVAGLYSSDRYLVEEVRGEPSANCVGDLSRPTFDGNRRLSSKVDKEGRTHNYNYDDQGRPLSITRAVGTPEESTFTATWHETYNLPLQTIEPGITTDYTYDSLGRIQTLTQMDTSSAGDAPRTWSFTHAGPNMTSVDGPLSGTSDTQYFTYAGERLTSVTNELGHTTTITAHNPIGAPRTFEDPNGVVTQLIYDNEHRLQEIIQSVGLEDASTKIGYDSNDQIQGIIPPNGAALQFIYDDARRLIAIESAVGDRIEYTRNLMGTVTHTNVRNGSGAIEFSLSQVTDELNRVIQAVGAGAVPGTQATTEFAYDREHNLTSIADARGGSWQQQFDGLDRLVKDVDPLGAETTYDLNTQATGQNPLSAVTDARNVMTNYVRNGFGEVIREVSLEAGITEYVRDTRGLVTQMTDARGIVSNYAYDGAGRLLSVTYPSSPDDDLTYIWGQGQFGIGRLSGEIEGFGRTDYTYTSLGFLSSMTRTLGGQSYVTAYTYDLSGEVLTTTYPSGRIVRYVRDDAARIIRIETQGPEDTGFMPLVENITYVPFGPLNAAEFADGHDLSITYDQPTAPAPSAALVSMAI